MIPKFLEGEVQFVILTTTNEIAKLDWSRMPGDLGREIHCILSNAETCSVPVNQVEIRDAREL